MAFLLLAFLALFSVTLEREKDIEKKKKNKEVACVICSTFTVDEGDAKINVCYAQPSQTQGRWGG
jgi:uncharacterized protein YecT (DUF1311 family)